MHGRDKSYPRYHAREGRGPGPRIEAHTLPGDHPARSIDLPEWESVTRVMVSKAVFTAKLLCGEMPNDIELAFSEAGTSLFPRKERDLKTSCSCPDYANPCKHIAAVYFILAERFDSDPFMIFHLRGRTREDLLKALREARASNGDEGATVSGAQAKTEEINSRLPKLVNTDSFIREFWNGRGTIPRVSISLQSPMVDKPLLRRLDPSPFSIKGLDFREILSKIQDDVRVATLDLIIKDTTRCSDEKPS